MRILIIQEDQIEEGVIDIELASACIAIEDDYTPFSEVIYSTYGSEKLDEILEQAKQIIQDF
jgi:hypothetical protein